MKNVGLPKTKRLTGYTWIQGGFTSMTGNPMVLNRFYNGESLGLIVHFNDHHSIWIQETFVTFKVVGPGGPDIYEVKFEHGSTEWRIILDPDGTVASVGFRPL